MCTKAFAVGRVLAAGGFRSALATPEARAASIVPAYQPHWNRAYGRRQIRPCSQVAASHAAETGATLSAAGPGTEVKAEDSGEPDKLYKTIELEVKGHDPAVLRSYKWYAMEAARLLDITVSRTWEPERAHERWTLLKAPFGKKKHMVQYEMRTHFHVIELKRLTGSTADTYLEYIQRNLPEGVAMKVTKTTLERLPSYIRPPAGSKEGSTKAATQDAA